MITLTIKELEQDAKKLSNKKLKEEYEGINSHIANFSFGRFELIWRDVLLEEMDRREI